VPTDRIRQTLDYLVTTGPTSFRIFLEALTLTGNANLVRELDPDYLDSEDCKNLMKNDGKLQSSASLITRMGNSKTPEQTRSTLISQQISSCSADVTSPQLRIGPHLTGLQNISRSSSRSHVINYTNNDSISMIPTHELTWNDINNIDLDFEVLSNDLCDFYDDIFKNQEDVSF
jgi:hypothetical protein